MVSAAILCRLGLARPAGGSRFAVCVATWRCPEFTGVGGNDELDEEGGGDVQGQGPSWFTLNLELVGSCEQKFWQQNSNCMWRFGVSC